MSDFMQKAGKSFGLFFRRAREVGDEAAEVTGTRLQEMRLAAGIRRLQGEREQTIKQIGAKVYTLHTRGKVRNQDVVEDCRKVDGLSEQIKDLRRQIEDLERKRTGVDVALTDVLDEGLVADEAVAEDPAPATAHVEEKGEEPSFATQPTPTPASCDDEGEPDAAAEAAPTPPCCADECAPAPPEL